MTMHKNMTGAHLHPACRTVADATARTALEATLTADDAGLLVLQLDTDIMYLWTGTSSEVQTPTTFLALEDTPSAFTDSGSKLVRVNAGATALEFVSATSVATADHDHSGDTGDGDTFDAANLESGESTDGQVLTSDGSGGAAWESLPALAAHDHSGDAGDGDSFDAANLESGEATDGQVLTADGSGGTAWESVPTLGDHDHSGDSGDGGSFDAANLASGESTDGQVLTSDGAGGAAWESIPTLADHDHTGDAGDGGKLEADLVLKATGDTDHHMLAADGANGVEIVNPGTTYYVWFQVVFSVEGDAAVVANPLRIYVPVALTIDKVYIAASTAPTGAALIVDVEKNGTTIFTDQNKRPSIAAEANVDESDAPDVTALAAGDYLTMSVDQVGSTVAGADLTVHVRCKQYLQF